MKPNRRALPTLFVSNNEYEILDEISRKRGINVAQFLGEILQSIIKAEGRVVVLSIDDDTYAAFAAFFEDEFPEQAMARCVMADGDDFKIALEKVRP